MDAPPAKKTKGENSDPTVIRLRVENPDKLDHIDSPEVIVSGFPVLIRVKHFVTLRNVTELRVLAYPRLDIDRVASNYFFEYTLDATLINNEDADRSIQRCGTGRFDSHLLRRDCHHQFAEALWSDPSSGFLKDGALTFDVSISSTNSFMRRKNHIDFMSPSDLFDVTFIIEGTKVHASRKFLSSQSEVFNGMFSNGFMESDETAEISIPDVKLEDFLNVLNFLYRTGIYVEESNFEGLLAVADKYNITTILCEVEKHLLEDYPNSMGLPRLLVIAEQYRLEHLRDQIIKGIKTCKDIEDLKESIHFASLNYETKDLLFDKHIALAKQENARAKEVSRADFVYQCYR